MRPLFVLAIELTLSACAAQLPAEGPEAEVALNTDCQAALDDVIANVSSTEDKVSGIEALIPDCRDDPAAQMTLGDLARSWHSQATSRSEAGASAGQTNAEHARLAIWLYDLYAEYFPDADDASSMAYYRAELLWNMAEQQLGDKNQQREAWVHAASAFDDVARRSDLSDKLETEVTYASVLAWKHALALGPRTVDSTENPEQRRALGPEDTRMVESMQRYVELEGVDVEEALVMRFLIARVYWRHNQYDRAIPLLEAVLRTPGERDIHEYSANILLDTLVRSKDYDALRSWVDEMLADERLTRITELAEHLNAIAAKLDERPPATER